MSDNDHEAGYFGKEDPHEEAPAPREPESSVAAASAPVATVTEPASIDDGRNMGHLDKGHAHGPTDGQYFQIFWVLFALTALEVSTYFWEDWLGEGDVVRRVGVGVLLVIMLIKFTMIAGIFMHLRFDAALLRRVFIFGLVVALAIYTIMLTSMNIWTDNGNPWMDDIPPPVTTTTVPEAN
ncbi:MAG: cytochrome C oxidase subunit IV family protein [Microthrixaceae bacterium]